MAFSAGVEALNMMARNRARKLAELASKNVSPSAGHSG
jgi:hypothetical protein